MARENLKDALAQKKEVKKSEKVGRLVKREGIGDACSPMPSFISVFLFLPVPDPDPFT